MRTRRQRQDERLKNTKVKVVAQASALPTKAATKAGREGIIIGTYHLSSGMYYKVTFPDGDVCAYLTSELKVVT